MLDVLITAVFCYTIVLCVCKQQECDLRWCSFHALVALTSVLIETSKVKVSTKTIIGNNYYEVLKALAHPGRGWKRLCACA